MAKYTKRPDGRYEAKVNLGVRPDGSYIRKGIYGHTIAELEENIRQAKNQHEQGVDLVAQKPTVKVWADKWLEVYKVDIGHSMRTNYSSHINKWLAPLHGLKIDKVRQVQLQEILQAASLALSQSSVEKLYNCICGVFSTARENGLTSVDISETLKKPKGGPKTRREALTNKETEIMAKVGKMHENGLLPMLMLYAGLRIGEALALTYDDIKGGYVNVNKTVVYGANNNSASIKNSPKTDAGFRRVPIVIPLQEVIDSLEESKDISRGNVIQLDSALIFSKDGLPYSKTMSRRRWADLMEAFAKAWQEGHSDDQISVMPRKITAHMLRHTFITSLYDADIDVKTAQKWAGHATVAVMLDIYTHLSEGKEKESEEKLKTFFSTSRAQGERSATDNPDDNFDDTDDRLTTKNEPLITTKQQRATASNA